MGFPEALVVVATMAIRVVPFSPTPRHHATANPFSRSNSRVPSCLAPTSSPPLPWASPASATALRAANTHDGDLASQIPSMGLNELQTQFRQAISRDDMEAAKLYRDELAERVSSGAYRKDGAGEDAQRKQQRLSWSGLGTAPWLIDRLQVLKYPLPTTIQ